jgi:predicted pyridoxine 5'-phosphate oxidase superfamily flavin-nucleotide-binding protein
VVGDTLPGSRGEHTLQVELGSDRRARAFYGNQMLDHLNEAMRQFIGRQSLMFIASADGRGECDCSFRAGDPGFVLVIDEKHVMWPEYRGNGVMASGGNVRENPHMGLLLMDFEATVGLHLNGRAELREDGSFVGLPSDLRRRVEEQNTSAGGKRPAFWFRVEVEEAYLHCAKHVPRMVPAGKVIDWGTDDDAAKGGDFFGVRAARAAAARQAG